MPRKMASGVVADPTAILGVGDPLFCRNAEVLFLGVSVTKWGLQGVRLWLRRGGRLASCRFSTSGSVLGPC